MKSEIERVFDSEMEFSIPLGEEGTKTFDMGKGTKVEFHYSDEEDEDIADKLVNSFFGIFSQDVYARSSSETVTKEYGKRKCTDYFVVVCAAGMAMLYLTNHYTLSKNGIKERYGESCVYCNSFLGTVSAGDPYITDSVATKPGKSNTNMKCRYDVMWSGAYLLNCQYCHYIESILEYKSINTKNKTITLAQKFKLF